MLILGILAAVVAGSIILVASALVLSACSLSSQITQVEEAALRAARAERRRIEAARTPVRPAAFG